MLLSQFLLTFVQTQKELFLFFITKLVTILMLIVSPRDHLRDVPWQDVFKLGAFADGV